VPEIAYTDDHSDVPFRAACFSFEAEVALPTAASATPATQTAANAVVMTVASRIR
jgi:hypothetical protein